MKKIFCILSVAVAVLCLMTACNFTMNFSDSTGNSTMQAAPKVEEMLEALTANDSDAALALMHPGVTENAETPLEQLSDYLAGRKIVRLERQKLSVNSSSGSAGNVRQESAAYQVEAEDGEIFYISVVYLTNSDGEGFSSFQIVIGVV